MRLRSGPGRQGEIAFERVGGGRGMIPFMDVVASC